MRISLLLGASLVLASTSVCAEEAKSPESLSGWYVTAGAGGSWAAAPTLKRDDAITTSRGHVEYQYSTPLVLGPGVALEAGVGFKFNNNLRSEITYLFNNYSTDYAHPVGTISYNGGPTRSQESSDQIDGSVNTNSILANVYYDIPTNSRWVPYVGGGIGWTSVNVSDRVHNYYSRSGAVGDLPGFVTVGSNKVDGGTAPALGYQAKIGLSYLASKSTDVYVEGVYLGNTAVNIGGNDPQSIGALNTFGIKGGLRYRFGK